MPTLKERLDIIKDIMEKDSFVDCSDSTKRLEFYKNINPHALARLLYALIDLLEQVIDEMPSKESTKKYAKKVKA